VYGGRDLNEALVVIAGVVAGGVVAVAGATKLVARDVWAASARSMGVPRVVWAVLPWLECVLGAAVVARIAIPWSALVLIALLAVFTAWLVTRMRAVSPPVCACFGAFSTRPVSWRDVLRNAGLIVAAGVASISV